MIKTSLAVSVLLTGSQAHSLKKVLFSKEKQYLRDSSSRHVVNTEFFKYPHAMATAALSASFEPTSCTAGIERFEHGPSNSQATWDAAKDSSTKWEDPEFTADQSSITWSQFGFGEQEDPPRKPVKWLRPEEMDWMEGPPSLWGSFGKPLPQGIDQGKIGDCWFLAAISAVAEQPERIERIFVNKEYSKAGIFRTRWWIKDQWYYINVDDRLPIILYGGKYRTLGTSASKYGDAWWVPILEKSFAKLDQNYDRIEGGYGREGLRTLTGMPTLMVYNDEGAENLLPVHKYISSRNFPSVASCCNEVEGGIDGLITSHAYTFLDVQELKDSSGKVAHVIAKLRNPWSSERYIGKWNDDDDESWTDEWKEQVNLVDRNDGIFWMPYENFLKFFRFLDVAYYGDYKTEFRYFEATARNTYFRVYNPVDQELFFTGEVYSGRHFPRAEKCDIDTNIRLYLRKDGKSVEPLRSSAKINHRGFASVGKYIGKLPKGEYQFRILNRNAPGGQKNVTIQISASEQLPTITDW